MGQDERGIALPMVMAVSVILFILITLFVSQTVRGMHTGRLYGERMRVQYAAESGIAWMQHKLRYQPDHRDTGLVRVDDVKVHARVLGKDSSEIYIESTAYGRFGVKQTIRVWLDPETLAVTRWVR
ncbi:hypothetical protein [Lihuaxuella thermophila]|uniref:Uncharacterized protein n=1 Tax=Lihuaxuella thermophila TaxID=1173111 RepID=A0A1H8DHA2_9BACL|nr:hypothetical protein [Lihuaxuella thermophila]SEN06545.1 hypothetical protein SAMN05444955_105178 [Lihuaxuella thermophila]